MTTGLGDQSNQGESGYVGYEMWLRALETRVDGIASKRVAETVLESTESGPKRVVSTGPG